MPAELLSDAEMVSGVILVGLYVAASWPLRRMLASPVKPSWLRGRLNPEYVMLTHIAMLLAGLGLLARGWAG